MTGRFSVSIIALAAAALFETAATAPTQSLDLDSKLINDPANGWNV